MKTVLGVVVEAVLLVLFGASIAAYAAEEPLRVKRADGDVLMSVEPDGTVKVGVPIAGNPEQLQVQHDARIEGKLTVGSNTIISGSLGVGTTTPSVPLDVSGNARVDGNLTVTGALIASGSSPVVVNHAVCQGRLTLVSCTPVTTTDCTYATTLYFTPYFGNMIGLYSGTGWTVRSFSELALSLSSANIANRNYDVFVYMNGESLALSLEAWSGDHARSVDLVMQDGIYVKSQAPGLRYLGTIRTTSTPGMTENSEECRFVWNAYNRVRSHIYAGKGVYSYFPDATYVSHYKMYFVCGLPQSVSYGICGLLKGGSGSLVLGLDTETNGLIYVRNMGASYVQTGAFADQNVAPGCHYLSANVYGAPDFFLYSYYITGSIEG